MKVLDYGYVELIETWGSDERIIESARMSTNKGFQGWGPIHQLECPTNKMKGIYDAPDEFIIENSKCTCTEFKLGDEKLLKFLYDHKHLTPFEMAGATFEIQAPIFVFREWHRHRTQSYNEMSARYTPMPDLNYVPTVERIMISGGTNKQAQGIKELNSNMAGIFTKELNRGYNEAQSLYEWALDNGIPKEIARLIIPVGRYSKMRASANLRNWLGFLTLRMEKSAQWEIRQYANLVHELLAQKFPRVMVLFGNQFDRENS